MCACGVSLWVVCVQVVLDKKNLFITMAFSFENVLNTCFSKWKLEVYKKAVQDGEVPAH